MRRSDPPPMTRGVVLRALGLLVALGLGAVGIWMIANGAQHPKQTQIGAFAEFWALLIGAFAIFGSRRLEHEEAPDDGGVRPGAELELRARSFELERADEAARRRAHEERLEHILRHEVQSSVAREVIGLRDEIAQLRSELLEKVGGQLRLERIETTRVIGSDLEALQHELRELKHAARDTPSVSRIVEPARVRPVSRETAEVVADVQPAVQPPVQPPVQPAVQPPVPPAVQPAPEPEPTTAPAPPAPAARAETPAERPETPAARPETPAARPEPPRPAPEPRVETKPTTPLPTAGIPAAPPPAEPRPSPAPAADPFAGLPRIRPFTDFELDPIDDEPGPYTGRRRRRTDEEQPARGRHSGDGSDAEERPTGRRRAPENGDELLARLLARGNANR